MRLAQIFILQKSIECLTGFLKLQPLKSAQGTYYVATVEFTHPSYILHKDICCILTETTEEKYQLSEDLVNQLPHGSDPPTQSLNQVFTAL